mmetsp:Transcript_57164/g.158217  ORF Transcript_57164/g.158217 Transcript_57164/m.158217 type:complete len:206 (+) Transcript_57164:287-904(+)
MRRRAAPPDSLTRDPASARPRRCPGCGEASSAGCRGRRHWRDLAASAHGRRGHLRGSPVMARHLRMGRRRRQSWAAGPAMTSSSLGSWRSATAVPRSSASVPRGSPRGATNASRCRRLSATSRNSSFMASTSASIALRGFLQGVAGGSPCLSPLSSVLSPPDAVVSSQPESSSPSSAGGAPCSSHIFCNNTATTTLIKMIAQSNW